MKIIIYNAVLLDETMNTRGALVLDKNKILRVLKGSFKDKNSAAAAAGISVTEKTSFIDAGGLTVSPAFIDMHAHFRYPGQTQKEDLDSALNAAARGGFGTLVLMPNTAPVVSSKEAALEIEKEVSARKMSRVFQTVSITKDFGGSSTEHLDALDRKTTPVISEDGRDVASASVLLEGMKKASKKGIIVACHSEDTSLAAKAKEFRSRALKLMAEYKIPAWGVFDRKALSAVNKNTLSEIKENIANANSLLELAEDTATERNIAIAKKAGCRVHICHVSTVNSLEAVRRAKKSMNADSGFAVTCEVTPHHLGLTGTNVPEIFAFVNPPLRSQNDRAAVIRALRDGTADVISTDHAPHTESDKANGAPGFTGLETAYALCHTVLVEQEKFSEKALSRLMSANPARILGLRKGLLKEGWDADLVFLDPRERWKVRSFEFLSKGKATPLEGKTLTGKVKALLVNSIFYACNKTFS